MDGDDVVKHLIITGVKFTDRELGQGMYSRIRTTECNGIVYTAKELKERYSLGFSITKKKKQDFLRECLLLSKLHHPNIVKMLGVYYPNDQAVLPVKVMELMECNLIQLLGNYKNIPIYVKLSILQDVSRAICYLHTLNPPMVHCDLNTYNIHLTKSLVAKVVDFTKSIIISSSPSKQAGCPGRYVFMPPEALEGDPHYGLPLDVFSFGCVICDVISQRYYFPRHTDNLDVRIKRDAVTVRRHNIDQISEGSLKQLVITCLDGDQERRPPISVVNERITSIITG